MAKCELSYVNDTAESEFLKFFYVRVCAYISVKIFIVRNQRSSLVSFKKKMGYKSHDTIPLTEICRWYSNFNANLSVLAQQF